MSEIARADAELVASVLRNYHAEYRDDGDPEIEAWAGTALYLSERFSRGLVSLVSWHRYADKQPEDFDEVRFQRGKGLFVGAFRSARPDYGPYWDYYTAMGVHRIDPHPYDLWCLLPAPPEDKP